MSETTPNPLAASLIRTFVPILVGFVITVLAKLKIDFHGDVTALVTAVSGYVYYFVVRVLEHLSGNPKFGWLLGKAAQPVYKKEV